MNISKHAHRRMNKRSIDVDVVEIMHAILPSRYLRQSNQIFLSQKIAKDIAKRLRNLASKIEKQSDTFLIFDPLQETLITAYRK